MLDFMLLGYATTAAVSISFVLLIISIFLYKEELFKILKQHINKKSLVLLLLICVFFTIISLLFVPAVEQLYFDENIYQGIALNIIHSGNSLWCQYGTGHLTSCYANQLYHDPVGFELFLGIALVIFGSGPSTAYAFQFFIGLLSVIGIFFLSSVLTERKILPVVSSLIFATIPELLIWTRTQAAPDLPFMMLTIYAFFFFVIFAKNENKKSLLLFLSSLSLVFYTRIEAFILLPIFFILYFTFSSNSSTLKETFKHRVSLIKKGLDNVPSTIIVFAFVLILLPQIFYIYTESISPQYGQPSGQSILSISNFMQNISPNLNFLFGTTSTYPIISSINILILSILGIVVIILFKKIKNKAGLIILPGLTIALYFLFYTFFYAGSVGYGVDVRFMLELLPFISILSSFGIVGLADAVSIITTKAIKFKHSFSIILIVLLLIVVLFPFFSILPKITIPISQMPQEYFNTQATSFIYNNYQKVPTSCLVFSFTPDIWYELNRSAAQVSYLGSGNMTTNEETFKNYSCFVFDYGYWCSTPEYKNSTCGSELHSYNISVIATQNSSQNFNFTLYKINNFT